MRRLSLTLALAVSFSLIFTTVKGFYFGAAGGGGACGCVQAPACPPGPPPSGCSVAKAVARGVKTVASDQAIPQASQQNRAGPRVYAVPDELDLRAAAFGVPIEPQPLNTIFDILHNLGESGDSPAQKLVIAEGSTNTDYFPRENDEDLTVSDITGSDGLYRSKEIRRAPSGPIVHVHRDSSVETTTIFSETAGSDDTLDKDKCSSVVLRKLMLENISDSSAESKRNINIAAESKFGGNVDVICSRGHFSYIFTSNLYCEATKGLTTCIAFRQSDKVRRR